MSNDLTSMAYLVLALVGRQGAGAHDLVRMATGGQRLYYAGAASKIYERAARLADRGYLAAERRPGRTRERTYYTLTAKGLEALQDWLELPSPFPRIQSDALVRVFASDLARDPAAVAASVRALVPQIRDLERELEEDERRAAELPHRSRQLELVRSLARRLLDAQLEWIAEVEEALGARGKDDVTLLVDGNNVMGARPDGWWRDRPAARRRLVAALDDYALRTGERVVVVFDGRAGDVEGRSVDVRFAAHADDLLAELSGPGVTVATSDRALQERARARGADVMGAGGFRDRLGA